MNKKEQYEHDFFAEREFEVDDKLAQEKAAARGSDTSPQPPLPNERLAKNVLGGVDDRRRVKNTLIKPFRWVCQILASSKKITDGRKAAGSGFVIGERTILTAAHNLDVLGHHADRFEIYVATDGKRSTSPLGKYICHNAVAHPKYPVESSRFDLAVLHLGQPLPSTVLSSGPKYGSMPFVEVDPSKLNGVTAFVTGYPKDYPKHDRPHSPKPEKGVQAFQYYCKSELRPYNGLISYELDTGGGQSGSPLVALHKGADGRERSVAIGIHIEGGTDFTGNFAVPLGGSQMRFVLDQLNQVGGSHMA